MMKKSITWRPLPPCWAREWSTSALPLTNFGRGGELSGELELRESHCYSSRSSGTTQVTVGDTCIVIIQWWQASWVLQVGENRRHSQGEMSKYEEQLSEFTQEGNALNCFIVPFNASTPLRLIVTHQIPRNKVIHPLMIHPLMIRPLCRQNRFQPQRGHKWQPKSLSRPDVLQL